MFHGNSLLYKSENGDGRHSPGFDFTPCGPEVACRKLAITAPAPFSPPSRLAPHAFRMRDAVEARRGARPRRLFGYATTQRDRVARALRRAGAGCAGGAETNRRQEA